MPNNKIIDLDRLSRFKDKLDIELDKKANVDGNYPTLTAGLADNLTPYSEDSGAEQENPFISNGTGTNNNTEIVTVGDYGLFQEKQGNSVVVNQLIPTQTVSGTNNGITIGSAGNGKYTITVNNATGYYQIDLISPAVNWIAGHKYLCIGSITQNADIQVYISGYSSNVKPFYIVSMVSNQTTRAFLFVGQTTPNGTYNIEPKIVDLTQWFGSNANIPQDLLDHPENFFRYYSGSLAYNAGELVSSNAQYLKCIGRQQWDEETESGYIRSADGVKVSDNSKIRMKNPIRVIPNTTYYYKTPVAFYICCYDENMNFIKSVGGSMNTTFTTPSNCVFIQAGFESAYGTTYNNDITISIYYEGESGYNQYYPYEVLENVDTGTEELHSAGSVYDVKVPSGAITRNVDSVDLSTLSWTYDSSSGNLMWYATAPSNVKGTGDDGTKPNAICSSYEVVNNYSVRNNRTSNSISISNLGGQIYVNNGSTTTSPTGMLYYELAEPTEEQGTPFQENLDIDDFGTMEFGRASDDTTPFNGVPQGNLIFYPVDYKAFIDTMYDYTDGSPENLVLQEELGAESEARSATDVILQNAVGGTLRHCLCVKETLDFDNTDFVDLGSLNWVYSAPYMYSVDIASLVSKPADNYTLAKVISTNFKTQTGRGISVDNLYGIAIDNAGYIRVAYSGMSTDVTTFKNAMKGVLLAYEKA